MTWAVSPVTGGTITGAGVYTASATAGPYSIVATWTPAVPMTTAVIIKAIATVEILAVPQLSSMNTPKIVQASGATQTNGVIQNSTIVGPTFPSVTSIDSSGDIVVRSGFQPPLTCSGSDPTCE